MRTSTTAGPSSATSGRRGTAASRSAGAAAGWASEEGARAGSRSTPPRPATRTTCLLRLFPQLRGRAVTHAWGGPIDVSPTHLPIFGSRGRVHHGFGFTGNGVGPSYLGGEILARLALDRRDELTRLALVEPGRKLMPPEPLRWAGGSAIRAALVRRDAAHDAGTAAGSGDVVRRLAAAPPGPAPSPLTRTRTTRPPDLTRRWRPSNLVVFTSKLARVGATRTAVSASEPVEHVLERG